MTAEMTFIMLVSLAGGYFIRYCVKELGLIHQTSTIIMAIIELFTQFHKKDCECDTCAEERFRRDL